MIHCSITNTTDRVRLATDLRFVNEGKRYDSVCRAQPKLLLLNLLRTLANPDCDPALDERLALA